MLAVMECVQRSVVQFACIVCLMDVQKQARVQRAVSWLRRVLMHRLMFAFCIIWRSSICFGIFSLRPIRLPLFFQTNVHFRSSLSDARWTCGNECSKCEFVVESNEKITNERSFFMAKCRDEEELHPKFWCHLRFFRKIRFAVPTKRKSWELPSVGSSKTTACSTKLPSTYASSHIFQSLIACQLCNAFVHRSMLVYR